MAATNVPLNRAVLDGAAGTFLESKGVALHPTLWSSGELLTEKGHKNIRELHRAYIEAGADVVTTVTYQASIPGLVATGISEAQSRTLIINGVELAREEAKLASRKVHVAAGLGPYGAYLSNGEEYTGNYGDMTTYDVLREFWVPRVEAVLAGSPDILLFETVPNVTEIEVIMNEAVPLAKASNVPVWISLSLQIVPNSVLLADGTPIAKVGELVQPGVQMVGANCFDVKEVPRVIAQLKQLRLPLILYPNSGEIYDGKNKTWSLPKHDIHNDWQPAEWSTNGVNVIGGCCRTSPDTIAQIKRQMHAL